MVTSCPLELRLHKTPEADKFYAIFKKDTSTKIYEVKKIEEGIKKISEELREG